MSGNQGAVGYDAVMTPESGGDEDGIPSAFALAQQRRLVGYVVGIIGMGLVVGILWTSHGSLAHLLPLADVSDRHFHFLIVLIASHAIVAVAGIAFGYQLLRAAERMLMPHWWVRNPEIAAVMLGMRHPARDVHAAVRDSLKKQAS